MPTLIYNQQLPSIDPWGIRSQGRGKQRDTQGEVTQPPKGSSCREPPGTQPQQADRTEIIRKQRQSRKGEEAPDLDLGKEAADTARPLRKETRGGGRQGSTLEGLPRTKGSFSQAQHNPGEEVFGTILQGRN